MKNQTYKLIGLGLAVFVVTFAVTAFFTLHPLTFQNPPSFMNGEGASGVGKTFKPEDMETYKAAKPLVDAYKAAPVCSGESVDGVNAKLAELREDSQMMAKLSGITGLEPDDYLKLHVALIFEFADAAIAGKCFDLADQQYKNVKTQYPIEDYAEYNSQADAGLAKVAELRKAAGAQK